LYSERFKNRVAVITGGASGVGLGAAARIAAEGGKVSLWDRDAATLAQAAASIGDGAHTVQVDVTDAAKLASAAESVYAKFGRLDVLIASAGITGPTAKLWEYPLDEWRRVIDIDVNGIFYACRAVVPQMLKNDYGRIVNISSVAGKEGNPNASAYSTAKAAVMPFAPVRWRRPRWRIGCGRRATMKRPAPLSLRASPSGVSAGRGNRGPGVIPRHGDLHDGADSHHRRGLEHLAGRRARADTALG
jgi:short chain dehydrogenase